MAKESKVGFAKPANGKVVHIVVDGLQACDKKTTLTADPELQITSVTCKKCQRFAFYKEILVKGQKQEEKSTKGDSKKKSSKPKKKVVDAPKKTPEEIADKKAAKEKDEVKSPGPVKHTKVNVNRKEKRNHAKLVAATQESLLEVLLPFQKEKIHEISIMRIFEEAQTHLRQMLMDACEGQEEKDYLKSHWTLDWRIFTQAFEKIGFAKLRGKDPDKGRVVLFYSEKAEKSKTKIRRRNNSGSKKTARVIKRRSKPKDKAEEEKKTGRVIKRRSKSKDKEKTVTKKLKDKNAYGHREGSMAAKIDEMLSEGFILKDAVGIISKEFNRSDIKARRKILAAIKYLSRELGIKIEVIMQGSQEDDFYKIV